MNTHSTVTSHQQVDFVVDAQHIVNLRLGMDVDLDVDVDVEPSATKQASSQFGLA